MKAALITLAMVATTFAQAEPYWQQSNSGFQQSGMLQMDQVPTESAQGKGKGKKGHQAQQQQQQQQQQPSQQQQQSPTAQQQQADVTTHAASYPVNPPPRPDYDY